MHYVMDEMPNAGVTFVSRKLRNEKLLVGTATEIKGAAPLSKDELRHICRDNRLSYADVTSWFGGGD